MDEPTTIHLQPSDALLVIDMQIDFLPGGRLPVKNGNEIIPGINAVAGKFTHVLLTADRHPEGHISFASAHPGKQPLKDFSDGPYGTQPFWPDHCVQGTHGAEITPKLHIPHSELVVHKGVWPSVENLSPFFDDDRRTPTGLGAHLFERGIKRLFFCGLALDVCVGHSAIDAARLGFDSFVLEDLTRPAKIPGLLPQVNSGFVESNVCLCSSGTLRSVAS